MVTRRSKRLVVEDDEDIQDNDVPMNTKAERTSTISIVDRLKRRAAKSVENAQIKRKKLHAEENDNDQSSEKPPNANDTVKKEQSIPKKTKKTQMIPKKSNDDKNGIENEKDEVKKDTPSLLSGMKKPPVPKVTVSKSSSAGEKGIYSNAKINTRPLNSSRGTTRSSNITPTQTHESPLRLSSVNLVSTPPPATSNLTDIQGPQADAAAPATKEKEGLNDQFGSKMRQLVFDGLKDLCKDAFEKPPERHGVDLFASFLRHKDLNPITQTSSINTDNNSNQQYDFFDIDKNTGTIVLQPKIPIFPEDFPAGSKEWHLSWWGIVQPSCEEKNNEDKTGPKNDGKSRSKSRQDRIGAMSDRGKEGNVDQNKRDNSRSTRKRSSIDRYEDEHTYYPHWEDRRDRFPDGQFDGIEREHPTHHGPAFNYDYDRNGRSPNRYPNSHHPHHRGGDQHFPNRTRDGPHSRPYHFDGPPPADFQGGGRPYPVHGGSGPFPWEYSHRDPHGATGRGPPPPRDDRREHRDRSHRPPHSKSERDDGRNLIRNPSSNNSNRKDRARTSR